MTNPYTKAVNAYRTTGDDNLTPVQVVAELYKGIIRFLREAKTACENEKYDQMYNANVRINSVIEALEAHLDEDAGGEDAKFLKEFYMILFFRLAKVLDRPDPVREYQQLIDYVMPVYERWHTLAYGPRPSVENTEEAAPAEQETAS